MSFEAVFEDVFNPQSAFLTTAILPFHVPVPDNYAYARASTNVQCGFILKFRTVNEKTSYSQHLQLLEARFKEFERYYTYVDMAFISPDDLTESLDKGRMDDGIVSTLLDVLNSFLTGYSFWVGDVNVHAVTNNMLFPLTWSQIFKIKEWGNGKLSHATLNTDLPHKLKTIHPDHLKQLETYCYSATLVRNPFLTSERFATNGLRNYRIGLRSESIVNIQTSIESFLKSAFLLISAFDHMDQQRVSNILGNFKNLLTQHLPRKIGGTWNLEDAECACGVYYQRTYKLRNEIIHRGYQPNKVETNEAIKCGLEFREYVIGLLKTSSYDTVKTELEELYLDWPCSYVLMMFRNDVQFQL